MRQQTMPFYLETEEGWQEFLAYEDEGAAGFVTASGERPVFVNVHEIDRAYGGPEEGGWWYDCGTAKESVLVSGLAQAREVWRRLRDKWADEDGADVGSVVYSGGVYSVGVDRKPARDYPEVRPHYE